MSKKIDRTNKKSLEAIMTTIKERKDQDEELRQISKRYYASMESIATKSTDSEIFDAGEQSWIYTLIQTHLETTEEK